MTPLEGFVTGAIVGAFSHSGLVHYGFEVEVPTAEGPGVIVMRARKTGTEVLITVTETRTPPRAA
jgi:hypothetical protein